MSACQHPSSTESFSPRGTEIDWSTLINLVDELVVRTSTGLSTSPCLRNLPPVATRTSACSPRATFPQRFTTCGVLQGEASICN